MFLRLLTRSAPVAIAALLLAACANDPVQWDQGLERQAIPGDSAAARVGFDAAGRFVPLEAPRLVAPVQYQIGGCPGSLRYATTVDRGGRALAAAVWWAVQPDSSARLVAAMSADSGRTWSPASPVDSLDRSGRGCARPAAAVAIEPRTRYVHVAYFLEAREGPGIFFSHSMDEGRMFHSPVAIVYGERPADVAVAASGDTVAVAYEDPNAKRPGIALALSATQGHIFEQKVIAVSPGSASAESPHVSLHGGRVMVGWIERPEGGGPAALVVRRGRVSDRALKS